MFFASLIPELLLHWFLAGRLCRRKQASAFLSARTRKSRNFATGLGLPPSSFPPPPQILTAMSNVQKRARRNRIVTVEDVSKHTSKASLWIIHDNKVYDVGTFLWQLPGEELTVAPCRSLRS